ncbi:T9SS type A sorting domain-containing protein [Crocinitomicaceae bacterium]|nr:T9SS type A sorting domain-containing protein [Crocinitomicaceae bacterium]
MKKSVLSIAMLMVATLTFSQITDMGGPVGWKGKAAPSKATPVHTMPEFDLAAIQAEDVINDAAKDAPWRFGYLHQTDLKFDDGVWMDLPGGNRLWRTEIISENAMTINLLLEDVYFPEGAHFYMYDIDQTNRVGAYTARNNREDGLLGTELVHGDHIVIEYFEPAAVSGQGRFTIETVVHGYRSLDRVQEALMKGLNDSGDCNIDVECPLGVGWENEIRSVAMIVVGGGGICTGALINNTCEDGRPLFLTANHCLGGSTGNWAFRFNWKSPAGTESCATTAGSTNPGPPYDQTANGATVLASGTQADHALLEMTGMTVNDAQTWNLYYAGWNHDDTDNGTNVANAMGIHHPSGDVIKICREGDAPYHDNTGGAAVWWIDQWEEGVTEPGSSGSPLFDQNHRIIGQLYGGGAACSGTQNNGSFDYYGRLGVSWGMGVSDHLAPNNCGTAPLVLDGWDPNGPTPADDASIQTVTEPNGLICGESISPVITLRNAGSNNLTSVDISYNIDGAGTQTLNWTGNLPQNGTEDIYLPATTSTAGAHVYNAFTTNPNGTTDSNPTNDAATSSFTIDPTGILTNINITTDCYGYENSWELRDLSSNLVAEGGNLAVPPGGAQNANQGDPGAYGNEITIVEKLCLAADCYDFTIFDDWGDGLEGSSAFGCSVDGTYDITNGSGTVLASMQNVDFGNSETVNFCVIDDASIDEINLLNLAVYPNPNNGTFTISLDNTSNANYEVTLTDLAGRVVYKSNLNGGMHTVHSDNLADGSYLLNLNGNAISVSKKVVIRH